MKSCGWKYPPNSLPELVNTVERYAASLNKDQIIAAVNDMLPRAELNRYIFIADTFSSNVEH